MGLMDAVRRPSLSAMACAEFVGDGLWGGLVVGWVPWNALVVADENTSG